MCEMEKDETRKSLTLVLHAEFSSLAAATLSSRPPHQSDTLAGPLHTQEPACYLSVAVCGVCVRPTISFFNNSERLKLQLHVLLDH